VAEDTLNVALNYIRRNPRVGLMIDGLYSVKIGGDDASAILETRMILYFKNVINLLSINQIIFMIFIFKTIVFDIIYKIT